MSFANTTKPDSDTPLAFLTPGAAYQTLVAACILVASLGVLIWDLLDSIPDEVRLLSTHRVSINAAAYTISRLGTLGCLIGTSIFQTAPLGRCNAGETVPDIFYPISHGGSAFLFFIRLRAVYNRDRVVVVFFFFLWITVVGSTMFIPITVSGAHVGTTQFCTDSHITSVVYAAILAPLIHDTLVFFAISWRLAQNAYIDVGVSNSLKIALFGKYLPAFSRGMRRDSQKYYFVTLISNVLTVITMFRSSTPITMRTMFTMPNIVLTNIMACRVYRYTRERLENFEDNASLLVSDSNNKR